MEASIMDGNKRRCSAVSSVTTVKNPISLARLVMEKSPHSYLAFSGAEEFGQGQVEIHKSKFEIYRVGREFEIHEIYNSNYMYFG
ncbi:hypothetical protein SLEP1_g38240 [Rubroshorea leprosula]|uniref:Uncharacterized protein n=1 Tax=Rubroshorea leprosula TaxID=152421 RepID=A0AAV5KX80_9ROSI|nr:hypothetical protein SLEP1_g38240 [Rubroshorea leprosula]